MGRSRSRPGSPAKRTACVSEAHTFCRTASSRLPPRPRPVLPGKPPPADRRSSLRLLPTPTLHTTSSPHPSPPHSHTGIPHRPARSLSSTQLRATPPSDPCATVQWHGKPTAAGRSARSRHAAPHCQTPARLSAPRSLPHACMRACAYAYGQCVCVAHHVAVAIVGPPVHRHPGGAACHSLGWSRLEYGDPTEKIPCTPLTASSCDIFSKISTDIYGVMTGRRCGLNSDPACCS